jgi:hypothetical protein
MVRFQRGSPRRYMTAADQRGWVRSVAWEQQRVALGRRIGCGSRKGNALLHGARAKYWGVVSLAVDVSLSSPEERTDGARAGSSIQRRLLASRNVPLISTSSSLHSQTHFLPGLLFLLIASISAVCMLSHALHSLLEDTAHGLR